MAKVILVTGSNGLIGSEVAAYFAERGWRVHGVDNNMRASFFGPAGDTRWNQQRLVDRHPGFVHHELDLRDRRGVEDLVRSKPGSIVHCAAPPSHDLAALWPFDDFDVNAVGTLNLLEAARQNCPEAPLVHMSTNKVYGDAPNQISLGETLTRWDYADPAFANGIAEDFSIDQSMLQGCGRYHGPGVRTLFRNADLLSAGRMSDWSQSQRRRTVF